MLHHEYLYTLSENSCCYETVWLLSRDASHYKINVQIKCCICSCDRNDITIVTTIYLHALSFIFAVLLARQDHCGLPVGPKSRCCEAQSNALQATILLDTILK